MPNPTGIRRTNTGAWAAIVDGKLEATFNGVGAKAAAIREAGTNREVPAATLSYPAGHEPVSANG